jgi:hypothetical protein
MNMLSPFDDEVAQSMSTRLDIHQPLHMTPLVTNGGGGAAPTPTNAAPLYLGNLATVNVSASDEPETQQNVYKKNNTDSFLLVIGIGILLLLAMRR